MGIPAEAPAIRLGVLGRFRLVEVGSNRSLVVSSQKTQALLTILAAAPGMTVSRAQIARLLWNPSEEELARQSLRQALSRLRRLLEPCAPGALILEGDSVGLDAGRVDADVPRLVAAGSATDPAMLAQAADLCIGELGADLDLNEPDFEIWLREQRDRLRDAAILVHDRLVRALAAEGRHEDALSRALALHAIDPLREETHRLVLEVESIASGRASALARYETFKRLLREELGVGPEAETRRIGERLRNEAGAAEQPAPPVASVAPLPVEAAPPLVEAVPELPPADAGLMATALPQKRTVRGVGYRRSWAAAAVLVGALVLGLGGARLAGTSSAAVSYVGEQEGRLSLAVLPFQIPESNERLAKFGQTLREELVAAIARDVRFSVMQMPGAADADPRALGRSLRVRYLLTARLTETGDDLQAQIHFWSTADGIGFHSLRIGIKEMDTVEARTRFIRQVARAAHMETALHRARAGAEAGSETETLLWRAEAARLASRLGADIPQEGALFEAVLAREPDNVLALSGLGAYLIRRVARNQTRSRRADLARAEELVARARLRAPQQVSVIVLGAMVDKLNARFPEALATFERALALDPSHWQAVAQRAHLLGLMGRIDEAYAAMVGAMEELEQDLGIGDSAFMAGEVALLAGADSQAVNWLRLAVRGNPTVARSHALLAAALELSGQHADAAKAAATARRLGPGYTPDTMRQRGNGQASPQFVRGRDRYVDAYSRALAAASTP